MKRGDCALSKSLSCWEEGCLFLPLSPSHSLESRNGSKPTWATWTRPFTSWHFTPLNQEWPVCPTACGRGDCVWFLLKRKPQAQNGIPCAKARDTNPTFNGRLTAVSTCPRNGILINQSGIFWSRALSISHRKKRQPAFLDPISCVLAQISDRYIWPQ